MPKKKNPYLNTPLIVGHFRNLKLFIIQIKKKHAISSVIMFRHAHLDEDRDALSPFPGEHDISFQNISVTNFKLIKRKSQILKSDSI